MTRDFRETVRARAARDPVFRKALFAEVMQVLRQDDIDSSRTAVRDFMSDIIGIEKMRAAVFKESKKS